MQMSEFQSHSHQIQAMTHHTNCPVELCSTWQSNLQFDLLADRQRMHRLNEQAVLTNVCELSETLRVIDLVISVAYEVNPWAFSLRNLGHKINRTSSSLRHVKTRIPVR